MLIVNYILENCKKDCERVGMISLIDVEVLGFGANDEELLRSLSCKKVVLLKHGDRTQGQKEVFWGCEEWQIIYFEVGSGLGTSQAPKVLGKQGFQDP